MAIIENRVDVKQTTAGSGPDGGTMFRICQKQIPIPRRICYSNRSINT